MREKLLPAVFVLLLLGGCGRGERPLKAGPPDPSSPESPAVAAEKAVPPSDKHPSENLPQPPAAPPLKPPQGNPLDKYSVTFSSPAASKLPLEIHIDVPDPPEEILRPSPPIREEEEQDKKDDTKL